MEITSKEPSLFYLWRLDEGAPQLLALCRQEGISVEDLAYMPPKRQREAAAERLLLCHAFGRPVTLAHTSQGVPVVEDEACNISISHTPRLVAVALHQQQIIGIDAEQADRVQVLRVRDKFLNAKEKQFIAADDMAAHIIAWTAKEAVIKAERNSRLDWTEGITVEPFSLGISMPSVLNLTAQCGLNHYRLTTRVVEGHYLTLAVACPG